ncbi:DUF924 domain-containing protein [Vibrio sp. Of7-15]|uniref:DUF924 family protein n=1 Tax=Vibrio sp. Of7-15 TaxID=2724879 RepID=UPI001EF30433|nr:DUF924 domain-containing protein [Vibrio sp. Of7-15]
MIVDFRTVIDFWFKEIDPKQWWVKDADFDNQIHERFGELHQQAVQGELFGWRESAVGRLAEIIVLDQFSRNIYRDQPQAFGADALALGLAQEAIKNGCHLELQGDYRSFMYMPFMHSESKIIHQVAEQLFSDPEVGNLDFELQHKKIIDQFGRYPHRNKILDRKSTPEEIEFLTQPNSSF